MSNLFILMVTEILIFIATDFFGEFWIVTDMIFELNYVTLLCIMYIIL